MAARHVLSFGGGVNSVALMVVLLQEGLPFDEAVFADTGGEVPETYQYLEIAKKYPGRSSSTPYRRVQAGTLALRNSVDPTGVPVSYLAMVNQRFQDHTNPPALQVAQSPHQSIPGYCLG